MKYSFFLCTREWHNFRESESIVFLHVVYVVSQVDWVEIYGRLGMMIQQATQKSINQVYFLAYNEFTFLECKIFIFIFTCHIMQSCSMFGALMQYCERYLYIFPRVSLVCLCVCLTPHPAARTVGTQQTVLVDSLLIFIGRLPIECRNCEYEIAPASFHVMHF